jgi:hypothetical protein
MKVAFKKKSRWERAIDPVASKVKGRTLTVDGKPLTINAAAKPVALGLGGLVIATVASAVVSYVRGQADK